MNVFLINTAKSIAIGALLLSITGEVIAQTPIKIGSTIPITGPLSLTGKQYFNSLKLAEEDINKGGGINGAPISIVIEDAQASNGTALNALVKVIQENKPSFLFLSSYSTQNAAVSPEVVKAGIPTMYAGGADSLSALKNPWMFRIRPQDSAHSYTFKENNGVHDVAVVKFRPGTKDMEFVEAITMK